MPKYEWVIGCGLNPIQNALYRAFVRNRSSALAEGPAIDVLVAYKHALQILNHPDVLFASVKRNERSVDLDDRIKMVDDGGGGCSKSDDIDEVDESDAASVEFDD